MKIGERDYMAPVRRKWVCDGWEDARAGIQIIGKLGQVIGVSGAAKVWDRVIYLSKVSAGIGPRQSDQYITDEQREHAKRVAERLLEVICDECKKANQEKRSF